MVGPNPLPTGPKKPLLKAHAHPANPKPKGFSTEFFVMCKAMSPLPTASHACCTACTGGGVKFTVGFGQGRRKGSRSPVKKGKWGLLDLLRHREVCCCITHPKTRSPPRAGIPTPLKTVWLRPGFVTVALSNGWPFVPRMEETPASDRVPTWRRAQPPPPPPPGHATLKKYLPLRGEIS